MINALQSIHEKYISHLDRIRKKPAYSTGDILFYVLLKQLDNGCNYIYKLLPTLTRFFPFSLIGQEKLYHYNNRHIRKIIYKLEGEFFKKKSPVLFLEGNWDRYFYRMTGSFTTTKHLSLEEIGNLAKKALKQSDSDLFVRLDESDKITILLPRKLAENY